MADVVIGGTRMHRGTRNVSRLRVTGDLNGEDISLWIHSLIGARSGPTLSLTSTLHGGEWMPIEFLRRLTSRLDPARMSGNLVVVPVANPVAFCQLERLTPQPESDSSDLNRSFGARWDSISEQIARKIVDEVLTVSDYLVDYHGGGYGAVMGDVCWGDDFPSPTRERSRSMALAFGYPIVKQGKVCTDFPGPRSIIGYAGAVRGIPAIGVEIGGAGFGRELEEQYLERLVAGTMSLMRMLGIIEGHPTYLDRYLMFTGTRRVHPLGAGYLHPVLQPEQQLHEVRAGELLGQVYSPYTFELLEELRAPCPGIAFYVCGPRPVRPGDWAFGLVDLDHPDSRWVSAEQA